jgi:hypothetical protein
MGAEWENCWADRLSAAAIRSAMQVPVFLERGSIALHFCGRTNDSERQKGDQSGSQARLEGRGRDAELVPVFSVETPLERQE